MVMTIETRIKIYGIYLAGGCMSVVFGFWGLAFSCLLTEFIILLKARKVTT